MADDERFTEFRELLEGKAPSLLLWRELCEKVELFGEGDVALEEELAPVINALISTWDDPLRHAPNTWIERLLEGEHVSALSITRTLDLRCQHLMIEDAELLSDSPEMAWIHRLNLAYNGLQNEGVIELMNSEHIDELTWLDLSGNSIEEEGIKAIAECEKLQNLKHLDLTGNWVNDLAASYLAESENLKNLESLVLRGNPIREAGTAALANSPFLCEPIRHFWAED